MVLYSTNVSELAKPVNPVAVSKKRKKADPKKPEVEEPKQEAEKVETVPVKQKKQKTEAQLAKLAEAREVRRVKKEAADEAKARAIVEAEQQMLAAQKKIDDKKADQKEKRRLKKLENEKSETPIPVAAKKEVGPPAWFLKHEENRAKVEAKRDEEKRPPKEVKAKSLEAATKVWQSNMVSRGGGRGQDVLYKEMFGRSL